MAGQADRPQEILSLPQGGGALSGIGEKFTADPHTGTANLNIPLPLPAGRSGFGPKASLAYTSGAGNGPFGLGWGLDVPAISRKTSLGVPVYDDATDVFILSGGEPGPGRQPGAGRHQVPAPHGGFLRPHRASQRAGQRLLAGAHQGRADQYLRHPRQRRQRPGGDHRSRPTRSGSSPGS